MRSTCPELRIPRPVPRRDSAFPILFVVTFLIATTSACLAPYHIGNDTLYPSDIQTVYVPMAESESFRRFLGERLTEAVCKQIETDTPFKVVNSPNADSVLYVHIVNDTKRVVIENRLDDPRDTEYNMQLIVKWANRKGDVIREQAIPLPPAAIDIGARADIVPEYGRSVASEQQDVINKLAAQIVGLMESPW